MGSLSKQEKAEKFIAEFGEDYRNKYAHVCGEDGGLLYDGDSERIIFSFIQCDVECLINEVNIDIENIDYETLAEQIGVAEEEDVRRRWEEAFGKLKTFTLHISWRESVTVEVQAKSLAEAKALFDHDRVKIPDHGEYVDDSLELDMITQ